MKNQKFEVKNVKSFTGMEGMGINCKIYVNGKAAFFYVDDATGGGGYYNTVYDVKLAADVEEYISDHEDVTSDINGEPFSYKYGLDDFVNELLKEFEIQKIEKSKIRRMKDSIVVVNSDDPHAFSYYKFNKPLNQIPEDALKASIKRVSSKLKPNESILNEFNFGA